MHSDRALDLQLGDRIQMTLIEQGYDSPRVMTGTFSRLDALGIWWIPDEGDPVYDFAFWPDIVHITILGNM